MKRRTISGIGLALLLMGSLSLAFLIQPVRTEPLTIIVPDDYPTIQEAINAADPTDTIFVHSGTYYERVVVNKSVSLIGENRETTIIDGNKTRDVIEVKADSVIIRGFTVRNGGRNGSELGRGIWIQNYNNVNVTGNIVSHNAYGIWLHTSDYSTLTDNLITSNNGTGLFWWNNNGTIIVHNNISNNVYDGVLMAHVTYSTVRENVMTANNQSGIALDDSNGNVITKNTISRNEGDGVEACYSTGNIISGNHISANDWSGISLDLASNNNITGNSLTNNGSGINFINGSSNNIFCHNKFINNTQQVYDASWDFPNVLLSLNIWDDGYPSGGNYWSDYEERYPDAAETDESRIWDTPYIIDQNNQDNYPLMYARVHELTIYSSPSGVTFTVDGVSHATPWSRSYGEGALVSLVMPETHNGYVWSHWLEDENPNRTRTVTMDTNITLTALLTPETMPPAISISSPENKTYLVKNVSLTFTVSEQTSWIGYSLDGQTNVTISGNITILGLSDGGHTLVVYANDTAGNTGASDMIYFSVEIQQPEPPEPEPDEPKPFPTLMVIAAVIIAGVGATLLVYFTKIRKPTEKTKQ